jgi:dihydrolipoamide dehydrogenase
LEHFSGLEQDTVIVVCDRFSSYKKLARLNKADGIPYRSGRFNFAALGRARCMDETEGFVKILAHAESDRMLGVHIVGSPRIRPDCRGGGSS